MSAALLVSAQALVIRVVGLCQYSLWAMLLIACSVWYGIHHTDKIQLPWQLPLLALC